MGMMLFSSCIKKANNVESNKKMSNPKDVAPQTSVWLQHVKNVTATQKSGHLSAIDKSGVPVTLEWTNTDVRSPNFSVLMKEICSIVVSAFTPVEVQFLKTHPELHDEYCASFEPIFKSGPVAADWTIFKNGLKASDWSLVEEKMHSILTGIQLMDYSNFGVNDVHCFVLAKDEKTKKLLGYIAFHITPNFAYGDVKASGIGIAPSEQNRGLGKILMSSIFKIVPEINHIPLSTRVTNGTALRAYQNWGFTPDNNPTPEPHMPINKKHWIYLEYNVDQADILQKTAASLIDSN